MGFWNTFIKVWEVRSSIEIQNFIENSFSSRKNSKRTKTNYSEVIKEINEKNKSWEENMDEQRDKIKNDRY